MNTAFLHDTNKMSWILIADGRQFTARSCNSVIDLLHLKSRDQDFLGFSKAAIDFLPMELQAHIVLGELKVPCACFLKLFIYFLRKAG